MAKKLIRIEKDGKTYVKVVNKKKGTTEIPVNENSSDNKKPNDDDNLDW